MHTLLTNKLVIAVSSSALFDLSEGHKVYLEQGLAAYQAYQITKEDQLLEPGAAFNVVQKLLQLNHQLPDPMGVEVILLSRNSSDTGLRVFNSIEHHNLTITRAAFTGGASPYKYVEAFGAHLFLSQNEQDVRAALSSGLAAAILLPSCAKKKAEGPVRIAFDGDAVLFSDESERVYQEHGLDHFAQTEKTNARQPLTGGPFRAFLTMVHQLQQHSKPDQPLLKTALVTARSAPAHERVIRTLRQWGVELNETLFLGGLKKAAFLKAFDADIFFDDQSIHCSAAAQYVPSGHVLHGITNDKAEP